MKETIYGRNAVYETLRARRRQVFKLDVAEGVQPKGRLNDIIALARQRKIPINSVPRPKLERLNANHQGVALEASGYPYSALPDMLDGRLQLWL